MGLSPRSRPLDDRDEVADARSTAFVHWLSFPWFSTMPASQLFRGGFVGVDVFFVISGYLITGLVELEMGRGVFSIVDFYERRIRRILPALCQVMIVCLPFAWVWLFPREMMDFARSIVAVCLFGANIFFNREIDVFCPRSTSGR